jgi:hypothetical protein
MAKYTALHTMAISSLVPALAQRLRCPRSPPKSFWWTFCLPKINLIFHQLLLLHVLRLVHLLTFSNPPQELIRTIDGPVQENNGGETKTRGVLGPSLDAAAAKLSKINSSDSSLTQTPSRDAPSTGGEEEGGGEKQEGDDPAKPEGRPLPAPPVADAAPAVSKQHSWDPFSDIAQSVAGERLSVCQRLPVCLPVCVCDPALTTTTTTTHTSTTINRCSNSACTSSDKARLMGPVWKRIISGARHQCTFHQQSFRFAPSSGGYSGNGRPAHTTH